MELINGCGMDGSKEALAAPFGGADHQAPVVRPEPGAREEAITPAQLLSPLCARKSSTFGFVPSSTISLLYQMY